MVHRRFSYFYHTRKVREAYKVSCSQLGTQEWARDIVWPNTIPSYANLCQETREACEPGPSRRIPHTLDSHPPRSCYLLPLTRFKICPSQQGYLTFLPLFAVATEFQNWGIRLLLREHIQLHWNITRNYSFGTDSVKTSVKVRTWLPNLCTEL